MLGEGLRVTMVVDDVQEHTHTHTIKGGEGEMGKAADEWSFRRFIQLVSV